MLDSTLAPGEFEQGNTNASPAVSKGLQFM